MESQRKGESFLYIKLALKTIRRYWILFTSSVILFLALAVIANKTLQPYYQVSSLLLIDLKQENIQDPAQDFMKTFSIFNPTSDIQREILKMKSSGLIAKAIEAANLRVAYFSMAGLRKTEIYSKCPFTLKISKDHIQPEEFPIGITLLDNHQFSVNIKAPKGKVSFSIGNQPIIEREVDFNYHQTFNFGDTVSTEYFKFVVQLDSNYQDVIKPGSKYAAEINDMAKLIFAYQSTVIIEQVSKDIHAISVKMKTPDPPSAIAYINALTAAYLQRNVDKKNNIASNTIKYLDGQLATVEDSLKVIETKLQEFRSNNQIMEIGPKAEELLKNERDLQLQKEDLIAKGKYYEYINTTLEQKQDGSKIIVPSSMGINDNVLTNLIDEYIKLNNDRNVLIENNQTQSPVFEVISTKIDNQKKTLQENLNYLINLNKVLIQNVNERIAACQGQISNLPVTERVLVGIERQYKLNDDLYNFMLRKKAEAKAAKASDFTEYDILEPAQLVSTKPVSPNKPVNILVAFLLGISLPFLVVNIMSFFDDSIQSPQSIKYLTAFPTIGNIYKQRKPVVLNVLEDLPYSPTAESIRSVRNNLIEVGNKFKHPVILFTSCSVGDGKSFTAFNIANGLGLAQKKTILLNFELHKSNQYPLQIDSHQSGVAELLAGKAHIADTIVRHDKAHFDFIHSGKRFDRPSELLTQTAIQNIVQQLQQVHGYEYILIDAPPLGVIADAQVLMRQTDINIIVARHATTSKSLLSKLFIAIGRSQIKNVYWLYNGLYQNDLPQAAQQVYFEKSKS